MRLVLAVLLLSAACGPKASSGPAWPKMTDKEADGGESLAPRAKAASVAAASSDDDTPVVTAVEKPVAAAAKPDAETPKPATATPAQAPDDIIITTEEIVIEIDD